MTAPRSALWVTARIFSQRSYFPWFSTGTPAGIKALRTHSAALHAITTGVNPPPTDP